MRGERVEALERAEDRGGPGPVSGEVQDGCACVTGELSGDVQDSVTQPLGLGDPMFAVEGELLGPDDQIVGVERELEPRGVRLERVEREVRDAGCFQVLDADFDLGVLTVVLFQRGEIVAGLVGDEALEAVPVEIGERQLRAGMGRSRRQINRVPSGQCSRFVWPVSSVTHAPSRCSPSALIARSHAVSGTLRIASRVGALIAYPSENRMSVSRHANANS